jgi:hypothetical protein
LPCSFCYLNNLSASCVKIPPPTQRGVENTVQNTMQVPYGVQTPYTAPVQQMKVSEIAKAYEDQYPSATSDEIRGYVNSYFDSLKQQPSQPLQQFPVQQYQQPQTVDNSAHYYDPFYNYN